MILIDPKRIELNHYESIPHLLTPVVSSPKEASAVLANCLAEMERRYERLSSVRARNLNEANRAFRQRGEHDAAVPARRDRRARRPDDGRAAGGGGRGHPPRAEVARRRHPPRARDAAAVRRRHHRHDQGERPVAHRVRRLVADRLARHPRHGRRRVAARPGRHALQAARHVAAPARAGRVRLRGGDRARRRADRASASRSSTRAISSCPRSSPTRTHGDDHGEFDPDDDPLLDRAIEIVVQTQTASVSLLQRRLRVGYTRAGRLVDMLERRGIISGYEGSKPRRVLVDEAAVERLGSASDPERGSVERHFPRDSCARAVPLHVRRTRARIAREPVFGLGGQVKLSRWIASAASSRSWRTVAASRRSRRREGTGGAEGLVHRSAGERHRQVHGQGLQPEPAEGPERREGEARHHRAALQSNATSDYAPNFNTAIRKGAKLVIAAGFLLANTEATYAKKFPNVDFAITDYTVHTAPFADKKGNVLPASRRTSRA